MIISEEELWQIPSLPTMIVVTTNGMLGDQDELVMGTGAARQAVLRIKGIAKECGALVQSFGDETLQCKYLYGFLPVRMNEGKAFFGIFQVKQDWRTDANPEIILKSCRLLRKFMVSHNIPVRMNYPGIGAGHLRRGEVEPMLRKHFSDLDLTVCTRPFPASERWKHDNARYKAQ